MCLALKPRASFLVLLPLQAMSLDEIIKSNGPRLKHGGGGGGGGRASKSKVRQAAVLKSTGAAGSACT